MQNGHKQLIKSSFFFTVLQLKIFSKKKVFMSQVSTEILLIPFMNWMSKFEDSWLGITY